MHLQNGTCGLWVTLHEEIAPEMILNSINDKCSEQDCTSKQFDLVNDSICILINRLQFDSRQYPFNRERLITNQFYTNNFDTIRF